MSSVFITLTKIIDTIIIKLFPNTIPKKLDNIQSFLVLDQRLISGEIIAPTIPILIANDTPCAKVIEFCITSSVGSEFLLTAINKVTIISISKNGTEYTLNFSIALYPIIAVLIINSPPIKLSIDTLMSILNISDSTSCAFSAKNPT